jgi:hypothetical protein
VLPIAVIAAVIGCSDCGGSKAAASTQAKESRDTRAASERIRDEALAAARVWAQPLTPIPQFDFAANPAGDYTPSDDLSCRFAVEKLSGATPKFHCLLPDGRNLKIKYGWQNAEVRADVAGTRLLRALGFGADDMFVVRAVHCAGCPRFPFPSLECHERFGVAAPCFGGAIDYSHVRTFTTAVFERRMEGTVIEAFDDQGWNWYELARIDPSRGGSSRTEVDAFRLLAVLLAHWDNKGPNQRLICPPGRELPGGGCAAPIAMIQDVGATFGPNSVDLRNWRAAPVWRDRATCMVSMKGLPYAGATFPDTRISEAGRLMMARLLDQLSTTQLTDLFTASRIILYDAIDAEARDAGAWVRVFLDKARQVREGAPCPQ